MTTKESNAAERLGVERYDVLEDPDPKKGCNVAWGGRRCRRQIVKEQWGPFGLRRLCRTHAPMYSSHDRVLVKILSLPKRRDILD